MHRKLLLLFAVVCGSLPFTASGQLLQVLRPPIGSGNEGKLYAVAMSPDGTTVAVGGRTQLGAVYLFDRASGRLTGRLSFSVDVIFHLAFSPDGRWLAAVLGDSQGLRVWDWRDGGSALSDTGYGANAYGAAWSSDGRLATSSYDGSVRLYDLAGGRLNKLAQASAPGGKKPYALAFHPTGDRLAVGYNDRARVDVLDGRSLAPLVKEIGPSVVNVRSTGKSRAPAEIEGLDPRMLPFLEMGPQQPRSGIGSARRERSKRQSVKAGIQASVLIQSEPITDKA